MNSYISNIINPIKTAQAKPHFIPLQVDNSKHINLDGTQGVKEVPKNNFGQLLFNSLSNVNDLQQNSSLLQQQMLISPDSVDSHTVTIAMAKADMAISITKAVVDRAVQSYKDITTNR